ncbi:MAG: hypothetical protein ACNI25_14175 [Halarcobacter sp.]
MSISILTKESYPEVSKVKKEFNIFRAVIIKKGKLEMVEFFNKDGAFRGFGRDTKAAFKKARRVLKKHYR